MKEAGEAWIKAADAEGLERTTVDQYRQHIDLHIAPFIGRFKLANLNASVVTAFKDTLKPGILPNGNQWQYASFKQA